MITIFNIILFLFLCVFAFAQYGATIDGIPFQSDTRTYIVVRRFARIKGILFSFALFGYPAIILAYYTIRPQLWKLGYVTFDLYPVFLISNCISCLILAFVTSKFVLDTNVKIIPRMLCGLTIGYGTIILSWYTYKNWYW